MRLLIIECGDSKLAAAINVAAATIKPRPEMVGTMNLNMDRLNVPEFKHMLYHLAPDSIILNPPQEVVTYPSWVQLLRECVRHTQVTSGKLMFVSSFEALGDTYQRTEDAVELPTSEYGMFLQPTETEIENCPSAFIVRLPYTTESKVVLKWIKAVSGTFDGRDIIKDNQLFTLISIEDAAKAMLDRLQTGLYGKYHITPGDRLALSDLVEMEVPQSRIPDRSLLSKYRWTVESSANTWSRLCQEA